jgi:hypothetical protein
MLVDLIVCGFDAGGRLMVEQRSRATLGNIPRILAELARDYPGTVRFNLDLAISPRVPVLV